MTTGGVRRVRVAECLEEVTKGVGPSWRQYRLVGATREGLAPAKEGVGKNPQRYKPVEPGTIFYNPMRILLGSVAFLDEGEEPGITSPDYVVFKTRPGLVHPRWFYHWLRSNEGASFIRTLARGAVRERMLFRRLAEAEVEIPSIECQAKFARLVRVVERARAASEAQLETVERLPATFLLSTFREARIKQWATRRLADECTLLPSKSIASRGDTLVRAITTACLAEDGFRQDGLKRARMLAADVADSVVRSGEVLVARSNTAELVGRASLYEGEPPGVVASDLTIRIGPGVAMHPPFLAAFLSFLYLSGYWQEKAGGASGSMKKITRAQLADQPIPVPRHEEQRDVSRALSGTLSAARRIRSSVEAQLEAISALKDSLLRRASSGEL